MEQLVIRGSRRRLAWRRAEVQAARRGPLLEPFEPIAVDVDRLRPHHDSELALSAHRRNPGSTLGQGFLVVTKDGFEQRRILSAGEVGHSKAGALPQIGQHDVVRDISVLAKVGVEQALVETLEGLSIQPQCGLGYEMRRDAVTRGPLFRLPDLEAGVVPRWLRILAGPPQCTDQTAF